MRSTLALTLSMLPALGVGAQAAHAAPSGPEVPPWTSEPAPVAPPLVVPIVVPEPPTVVPPPQSTVPVDPGAPRAIAYPLRNIRLRLATLQSLNAASLAAEACVLLRDDTRGERCAPFPVLAGLGVGLGITIGLRDRITSDHVSAINGGTLLGAAHGGLILAMTQLSRPEGETERQVGAITTMALSQAGGTMLGHFVYKAHPSRPGVIDAATVVSMWSGLSTWMLVAGYGDPTEAGAPSRRQFGSVMLATDLGLALGVLFGRATPFTPYRALQVHGYVITSQLLALSIAGPVSRSRDERLGEDGVWRTLGYASLAGMLIGIGITHDEAPRGGDRTPLFAFDVRPSPGGALANVSGSF